MLTNFPKQGDDKELSLTNSNYKIFDVEYARKLKKDYPSIWELGGNIEGNNQYRRLLRVIKKDSIDTETDELGVRKREAWAARHFKNKNIAGVIAQIKWFVVGSRGEAYMKEVVQAEIDKLNE